MALLHFIFGILFSIFILPLLVGIVVLVRRMILDGSKVDDLSKKYILVTGCDTGFGNRLAKRLDSLGCYVIATCFTEPGLKKLVTESSSRLIAVMMDLTKPETIEAAKKVVEQLLPTPDALWGIVNNAGIASFAGPFDFEDIDNMRRIFEINLWGTVRVTKAFLPYLKKSKGRIVNVSSAAGRLSLPTCSTYGMTKFGVCAFTDCIRVELALWDISVHCIIPGFFKTEGSEKDLILKAAQHSWDKAPADVKEPFVQEWFKAGWIVADAERLASRNIGWVIDCMEHALLSTNPKLNYYPGYECLFILSWIHFLPTELIDYVLKYIDQKTLPLKQEFKK